MNALRSLLANVLRYARRVLSAAAEEAPSDILIEEEVDIAAVFHRVISYSMLLGVLLAKIYLMSLSALPRSIMEALDQLANGLFSQARRTRPLPA